MIKIGIDADGGDNGELEVLYAVRSVIEQKKDIFIYVYGNEESIKTLCDKNKISLGDRVEIIPTKETISMNEHPAFALRNKPNSSIMLAGKDLVSKNIDAFVSAGSTGALVALAQLFIRQEEGIERPVVAATVPTKKGPALIIDSGSNMDSKSSWLYQYAIIGDIYMKHMFNIENPRVGVLSVGTEENKGNSLTIDVYKKLKEDSEKLGINFIGNVEARDFPFGICDVLVTDGFSGNVLLKMYEGTAKMLLSEVKSAVKSNFLSLIGGILINGTLTDSSVWHRSILHHD